MKILFGYYEDVDFGLTQYSEIKFEANETKESAERKANYKKYLLSAIMEDFVHINVLDDFYKDVKNLLNGEIESLTWNGNLFYHKLTKSDATFICKDEKNTEYQEWSCPLKEYKRVLQAWKEFISLKSKPQTQIEVEI